MPVAQVRIERLTERHWPAVGEIYAAGIATGHATFETEPPAWEHFDATRLAQHRHVAVGAAGTVLGWVAASPVSERCVYAGVIEHSVYVHPNATGQGIGLLLLEALISSTEAAGIWTIQSGVFPENLASLAVHRRAGFRDVGTRHRLGHMPYGPLAGQWRDVILLERRSSVAGTTPSR
jgi:L-amino acid N-acyltransferase YncA